LKALVLRIEEPEEHLDALEALAAASGRCTSTSLRCTAAWSSEGLASPSQIARYARLAIAASR
jgi:hypothetical protein